MPVIVASERLGIPGDQSSRVERRGVVQQQLVYPTQSDQPTATCHPQPGPKENALCGYQWEGLIAVPGAESLRGRSYRPVMSQVLAAQSQVPDWPTPVPDRRMCVSYFPSGRAVVFVLVADDEDVGSDAPQWLRWMHSLDQPPRNTRTLWGRVPLPSLILGLIGAGIFVGILVTHMRRGSLDHLSIAGWLLAFGGFSLAGSLAMWSRTDYAESYGEPDPYAPSGHRSDKLGWWGRGELERAPLYRGLAWLFTGLGLVLLLAAGIAEIAILLA